MRRFNAVVLIVTVWTKTETRLWEQRHPWLLESQSVKSQVCFLAKVFSIIPPSSLKEMKGNNLCKLKPCSTNGKMNTIGANQNTVCIDVGD